ncbi:hypothetical protein FHW36_1011347 [Chitinophaga polysaccharea]|uniref:Uncharacterized protein n=1 Tax=Chitinophaga polysaccharea TaxID=1293035 RepID=A0A561Q4X2_9BACT|nr:hypothetical protein FHW36_1011347 [Chitinophaga polysaccharea]
MRIKEFLLDKQNSNKNIQHNIHNKNSGQILSKGFILAPKFSCLTLGGLF